MAGMPDILFSTVTRIRFRPLFSLFDFRGGGGDFIIRNAEVGLETTRTPVRGELEDLPSVGEVAGLEGGHLLQSCVEVENWWALCLHGFHRNLYLYLYQALMIASFFG
jgi:hypothetical protein